MCHPEDCKAMLHNLEFCHRVLLFEFRASHSLSRWLATGSPFQPKMLKSIFVTYIEMYINLKHGKTFWNTLFKYISIFFYSCVCLCECMSQVGKNMSEFLHLELQRFGSLLTLTRVLGSKFRSSGKAISALNSGALSPFSEGLQKLQEDRLARWKSKAGRPARVLQPHWRKRQYSTPLRAQKSSLTASWHFLWAANQVPNKNTETCY